MAVYMDAYIFCLNINKRRGFIYEGIVEAYKSKYDSYGYSYYIIGSDFNYMACIFYDVYLSCGRLVATLRGDFISGDLFFFPGIST